MRSISFYDCFENFPSKIELSYLILFAALHCQAVKVNHKFSIGY